MPPQEDIIIALTRIETKLDDIIVVTKDHEARLRVQEHSAARIDGRNRFSRWAVATTIAAASLGVAFAALFLSHK